MFLKLRGKKNKETRSYIPVTLGADVTTMILGYFFHNGEADAGTRIFDIAMKTGEDIEDSLGMLRFEANAIVAHLDQMEWLHCRC